MKISEEAMFRWVVIVGVAVASVIALTVITQNAVVGGICSLVLLLAAAVHAYRWWRAGDEAERNRPQL
jgi:hypothetical protein